MNPRLHFSHAPAGEDEDARVLPLINVVFLLLIFFMLSGSLSQADPFPIDPPSADAPEALESERLVIHVGADGRLAVGERSVQRDELGETVRRYRADRLRVSIKADGKMDATELVALLNVLRAAGVEKVNLLTVKRGS